MSKHEEVHNDPHGPLTSVQRSVMTSFTRTGVINAGNHKPFRTKFQKAQARKEAWQDSKGVWHSDAPISFHRKST